MIDFMKYIIKPKKTEQSAAKSKNSYTPSTIDRITSAIRDDRSESMVIREPDDLSRYKKAFEDYIKLVKRYRSLPSEFKSIKIDDPLFDKKCSAIKVKLDRFYTELSKLDDAFPKTEDISKMRLSNAVILTKSNSYELSRINGVIQELTYENSMDGEPISVLNYANTDREYEELYKKLDKSGLRKLSSDIQDMMVDYAFLASLTVRTAFNSSEIIFE